MIDRLQSLLRNPSAGFVLRVAVWIVALFGLLRLDRVQAGLLIPFANAQERVAAVLIGRAETGLLVNSSCTGSDALALCIGAILAFPTTWRRRLVGAAAGVLIVTAANTLRLASLALVVGRRELFELLHLKIWPAAIILVAAAYVMLWMRAVPLPGSAPRPDAEPATRPLWRIVAPAIGLVALYYLVVDRLYASAAVESAAHWVAAVAGGLMTAIGMTASVDGGVLRTAEGGWLVTPQCVLTPLIPLYLATVLATRIGWRRKALAVAATPLLFLALGTARLLVLALPAAVVGSHMVAVHAFYQLAVALAVVAWAAHRFAPSGEGAGGRRLARSLGLAALAAAAAGLIDRLALGPILGSAPGPPHLGHGFADPQGVLVFLLAFQAGLYVAASVALGVDGRRRRWWLGLMATALVAVATRVVAGEAATHFSLVAPTVLLRTWALAVPLALAWLTAGPVRQAASRLPGLGHAKAA